MYAELHQPYLPPKSPSPLTVAGRKEEGSGSNGKVWRRKKGRRRYHGFFIDNLKRASHMVIIKAVAIEQDTTEKN